MRQLRLTLRSYDKICGLSRANSLVCNLSVTDKLQTFTNANRNALIKPVLEGVCQKSFVQALAGHDVAKGIGGNQK